MNALNYYVRCSHIQVLIGQIVLCVKGCVCQTTAWIRTRDCSDASRHEIQCLRLLRLCVCVCVCV